jgi:hypothetical protein
MERPWFLCFVLCVLYFVLRTLYLVLCAWYFVLGTSYLVLCAWYLMLCAVVAGVSQLTRHSIAKYKAQSTKHKIELAALSSRIFHGLNDMLVASAST